MKRLLVNALGRIQRKFTGFCSFQLGAWRCVVHGFNAMHVAFQLHTLNFGVICFHPPVYQDGQWWPWYFYCSPDATPQKANFALGPGIDSKDRIRARIRRRHGYDIFEVYNLETPKSSDDLLIFDFDFNRVTKKVVVVWNNGDIQEITVDEFIKLLEFTDE